MWEAVGKLSVAFQNRGGGLGPKFKLFLFVFISNYCPLREPCQQIDQPYLYLYAI